MKKLLLFCFPYAGGSATVYDKWKTLLEPGIELCNVELAGKGRRVEEPLYDSVEEMVEDVYRLVAPRLTEAPYALFGHSMGSLVAYELAKRLQKAGKPAPVHVFFSGRSAPHLRSTPSDLHVPYRELSHEAFREKVMPLGGTSEELFEQPELMDILLPVLKNDFELAKATGCSRQVHRFDFDISVFAGKEELLTPEEIVGWKAYTNKMCSVYFFQGGHFFVNEVFEDVVKVINEMLAKRICEYTT